MFKKPNTSKKVWLCLVHGLFLFILLWYINNTSYSTSVDEGLLKKIFIVEDLIFGNKAKVLHNFVFIDVSTDISLVKDPKSSGYITITDRMKLGNFFKLLADHKNYHQYVLCDLYFDNPSDDDKLLVQQVGRCNKVLFAYHIIDRVFQYPVIKVPAVLSNYESFNDKFTKFKLVYDKVKTLPVVLHESLDSTKYNPGLLHFNSFSPRYYIRPFQLEQSNEYPFFKLGDLLGLLVKNSFLYNDILKDKFIVIGNFKADIHSTPVGMMPGPLILIDCYLSLKMGRSQFTVWWVIFMLFSLALSSYVLFFVKIQPTRIRVSLWIDFILHNFFNKVFSFLGICSAIVFISEVLFSIQLTISPLFFYLSYVSWAMSFYNEHLKHKSNEENSIKPDVGSTVL